MGNSNSVNGDIFLKDSEVNEKLEGEKSNTMLIKTYTWSKDSHGLYDYEGAHQIQKAENKIFKSGTIFKQDNNIVTEDEEKKKNRHSQPLISLQQEKNNKYVLSQNFSLQQQQMAYLNNMYNTQEDLNENSMWLIVRSLKKIKGLKQGWILKENDYLKLGRVRFRVKEICALRQNSLDTENDLGTNNNINSNTNNNNKNKIVIKKTETQGTVPQEDLANSQEDIIQDEGKSCRFCLSDTYTREDPLINPCNCQGSVKYVHIKCLQQWLQNKITTKSSPHSTYYMWTNLSCEICHHQYPHKINENGQDYSTFEMPKPVGPYIILEVLGKDATESKGIHVVTMEKKDIIKIGRGSESDMKITDISVSRCHAFIKFKKGKFYLEDHNSKFGTLALVKGNIDLSHKTNNMAVQVNRTVFTFFMKKPKTFDLACCSSSKKGRRNSNIIQQSNSVDENGNQAQNTQSSHVNFNNMIVQNNVNNQNIHRNMLQHQQQQQLRIERNIRSSFHSLYSQQNQLQQQQQQPSQYNQQNVEDNEGQLPIEEEKLMEDQVIQTQHSHQIKPNNLVISNFNNKFQGNSSLEMENENDNITKQNIMRMSSMKTLNKNNLGIREDNSQLFE